MIREDYVSFETAKLLKEKEFDSKCSKVWIYSKSINSDVNAHLMCAQHFMEGESLIDNDDIDIVLSIKEVYGNAYLAPTLQMAMKWLREVHNKFINLGITPDPEGWYYIIENIKDWRGAGTFVYTHLGDNKRFDSYEQAAEAAIKYCLENLI